MTSPAAGQAVGELSGGPGVGSSQSDEVADVSVRRSSVAEDAEPLPSEVRLAGGARLPDRLDEHPAQDGLGLADGPADRLADGDARARSRSGSESS